MYKIERLDKLSDATKKVQLAAVKRDGYAIKYIGKPSKEVQLAAVKRNGRAIEYIDKPSKEVQLAAVQRNGDAIQHIDKPSKEIQLAAVKQDSRVIQLIDKPSQEALLESKKVLNSYNIEVFDKTKIKVGCETKSLEEWLNTTYEEILYKHTKFDADLLEDLKNILREEFDV